MKEDKQVNDIVMRVLHDTKVDESTFVRLHQLVLYAYNMGYMKGHMDVVDKEIKKLREKIKAEAKNERG